MKKEYNFLDYIPLRRIEWAKDEKERVYLIKERARNRLLKRIVAAAGRPPNFHIHLDELGSGAWLLADGNRTVLEICRLMRERFGERVEPAAERVSRFFAIMKRNAFVDLMRPAGGDPSGQGPE